MKHLPCDPRVAQLEYGLSPEQVARRLSPKKAHPSGNEWLTCCPAHDDNNPSLGIKVGDNGGLVVNCHAGCEQGAVVDALTDLGIGLAAPKYRDTKTNGSKQSRHAPQQRDTKPPTIDIEGSIAALEGRGFKIVTYPYQDEAGTVLYEKVRLEHFAANGKRDAKTFRQRRPNGKGFIETLGNVRRVPYRLPELIAKGEQDIEVTEGEKDADRLAKLGLVATSIDSPDKCDLSALTGRVVYIHEDNDGPGREKSAKLAAALNGIALVTHVVRYPDTKPGGDVSNWLDEGHSFEDLRTRREAALEESTATRVICGNVVIGAFRTNARIGTPADDSVEPQRTIEWPETTKDGGKRQKSRANIVTFLKHAGVVLRYNAFALRAELTRGDTTDKLTDAAIRSLRFEAHALGLDPTKEFFDDAVRDIAEKTTYHPVRDYLDSRKWDGTPRLDTWLTTYAGAEDTDLTRAFGRKTLLAGVRRVRRPGCKFDQCLVFHGYQGGGKSSIGRALASDDWFTDCVKLGDDPKTVIEQTGGKWLVEIPELVWGRGKENEHVKAMLSRQIDRARLSYGRDADDFPRQFIVFSGSNNKTILRDTTGNRRFWIVKVAKEIDLQGLADARDQLWAEAAHYEAADETLVLPRDLWDVAADEQRAWLQTDPWFELLEPYLGDKCGAVAKTDIWKFLNIEESRQDPRAARRIEGVMEVMGFEPDRRRGRPGSKVAEYCFVREGWGVLEVMPWLSLPSVP